MSEVDPNMKAWADHGIDMQRFIVDNWWSLKTLLEYTNPPIFKKLSEFRNWRGDEQ